MLMRALLPVAAIAVSFAAYKYLKATKPEIPKRPPREQAFTVHTATVKTETVQPSINIFGTTVAGRQVEIRALVAGRVAKTGEDLKDGGTVGKGDLLVGIDPFDYRTTVSETEAQITEAKARLVELEASLKVEETNLRHAREQLKLAEKDLDRAAPLVRQGVLSRRSTDDREGIVVQRRQAADLAQNNIAVWKARADQQRATVARLETTLERGRQRLTETRTRSPLRCLCHRCRCAGGPHAVRQ